MAAHKEISLAAFDYLCSRGISLEFQDTYIMAPFPDEAGKVLHVMVKHYPYVSYGTIMKNVLDGKPYVTVLFHEHMTLSKNGSPLAPIEGTAYPDSLIDHIRNARSCIEGSLSKVVSFMMKNNV